MTRFHQIYINNKNTEHNLSAFPIYKFKPVHLAVLALIMYSIIQTYKS